MTFPRAEGQPCELQLTLQHLLGKYLSQAQGACADVRSDDTGEERPSQEE